MLRMKEDSRCEIKGEFQRRMGVEAEFMARELITSNLGYFSSSSFYICSHFNLISSLKKGGRENYIDGW